MGSYYSFYLGNEDGLESVFLSQLDSFLNWYWDTPLEDIEHYPGEHIERLERLQEKGRLALTIETEEEGDLIDEILGIFVGEYCDHIDGSVLYEVGDFTNKGRDTYAANVISASSDSPDKFLWRYVTDGRSLAYGLPERRYKKTCDGYKTGYWTAQEVCRMEAVLQQVLIKPEGLDYLRPIEDHLYPIEVALRAIKKAQSNRVGLVLSGGY